MKALVFTFEKDAEFPLMGVKAIANYIATTASNVVSYQFAEDDFAIMSAKASVIDSFEHVMQNSASQIEANIEHHEDLVALENALIILNHYTSPNKSTKDFEYNISKKCLEIWEKSENGFKALSKEDAALVESIKIVSQVHYFYVEKAISNLKKKGEVINFTKKDFLRLEKLARFIKKIEHE